MSETKLENKNGAHSENFARLAKFRYVCEIFAMSNSENFFFFGFFFFFEKSNKNI